VANAPGNRNSNKVEVTDPRPGSMDRPEFPRSADRGESTEAAPSEAGTHLVDRIASELDLLARNVDILEQLAGKPPMGIIRLSEALHLPIHKVRYSLHLLEREGVIQPSADGAVVTDKAREFWTSLDQSLDRMNGLIQHLKERAAEYKGRTAGRKGY
jgi:predicted transcriptional regulator